MGIFSGLFRSRDKPKDSYDSPSYTYFFGRTHAGKRVNDRTAMQIIAVYACVRVLSEAIAQLPLHVYQYTDKGKERVPKHPLYFLLHDQPNPEMTSFVFRETLMSHLLIYGNAFAQIIRNGRGEVLGLYPLMPDKVRVDRDDHGRLIYRYSRYDEHNPNFKQQGEIILPAEQVLHIPGLIKYAEGTGNTRNQIARILISYIRYGKLTVTSEAIAKKTGMNYNQLHNALRPFFRMGLLSHSAYSADGQKCYMINVGGEPQSHCGSASEAQYSTDVLDIIRSLINSEHAPKDNRIGKIIYSCLEKGTVTVDDYRIYGAEKKMHGDMRFAEKLGIVKKKSADSYEIMHDLSEHEIVLEDSLKNTLTMLYDIFGEDAFSIEMVAAKLDYSESHMSATLHQLAWLKILDSSDKDGRKRSYQLLVNPTDNPELFKAEAA